MGGYAGAAGVDIESCGTRLRGLQVMRLRQVRIFEVQAGDVTHCIRLRMQVRRRQARRSCLTYVTQTASVPEWSHPDSHCGYS